MFLHIDLFPEFSVLMEILSGYQIWDDYFHRFDKISRSKKIMTHAKF
jgi:hypothetical protein